MILVNEKNFNPTQDCYLVEPLEASKQEGSILLSSESSASSIEAYARIISRGPGKDDDMPLYEVGKAVFHVATNGLPLTFQGKKYLLLRERDILGVIGE